MTFLQIEYFVETVKCGSIAKAAEKLFVSHQALSIQIKALEKELDMPLFDRKQKRKLTLLQNGEVLFNVWAPMLDMHKEAIKKAKKIYDKKENVLRIGVQDIPYIRSITFAVIDEILKQEYFDIEFRSDNPERLLAMLEGGDLDCCSIISTTLLDHNQLHFRVIGDENKIAYPVIAVSNENPLSERERLSLEDIKNETILTADETYAKDMTTRIIHSFQERGITSVKTRTLKNISEVKMALCMNQGATIILDMAMTDVLDKVKLFTFEPLGPENEARIALAWKDKKWDAVLDDSLD